ncbi:MAG TPA: NAD(P)H-dependent glycerol-3-phosphate dehydrogenase [Acidimicrobiales bacterium]|jgi:glycerol-3-phosphate dehydrogenase (NAD(P)+)|nr:NAD(P)H-dependent glycerol-3-phosphate dehydrogenase [Acidimicrobiales bacterium]
MDRPLCVLGAGSWGTVVAALANGEVRLWARRPALAEELNATRRNPRYTGELVLGDGVRATSSLAEACAGAAAVLVAVPSAAFRSVAAELTDLVARDAAVLSLTKGVERGSHATMTSVLRDCLPTASLGVLTGPNLAKELALGMPAACVVALRDEVGARLVQDRLHGPSFRVYTTSDVIGCEVAGATKNVLAIAAGVSDGLGFGDNTRATIITRGLAEMGRLGVAMGGEALTFGGLAGVGDLVATCTSDRSRNRRVGIGLGRGASLDDAIADVGEVAEGVVSAEPLVALARDRGVELPICEQVAAMVAGEATPAEALAALSARPARGEWDVSLLRDLRR